MGFTALCAQGLMSPSKSSPKPGAASEAITNNVRVEVESKYAAEHSQPFQSHWYFQYTVRITNEGDETVQLIGRHWIITDGNGRTEEVRGNDVVGEQPQLAPGETFTYTSGAQLKTSIGLMRGTYAMVSEGGEHFDVEIAPFALQEPYTIH